MPGRRRDTEGGGRGEVAGDSTFVSDLPVSASPLSARQGRGSSCHRYVSLTVIKPRTLQSSGQVLGNAAHVFLHSFDWPVMSKAVPNTQCEFFQCQANFLIRSINIS